MPTPVPQWISLVPAEPWKNGGGVTRVLAESDGDWRFSVANVNRNGRYSRYEGMTRLSTVIEGQGVVLRCGRSVVPLDFMVPTAFDGNADWDATLVNESVVTFNIIARSDKFIPTAHLLHDEITLQPGSRAVVLAGHSSCVVHDDSTGVRMAIPANKFLVLGEIQQATRVVSDVTVGMNMQPPIVALIEPRKERALDIRPRQRNNQ